MAPEEDGVSTLLEILALGARTVQPIASAFALFQPFLRFWHVEEDGAYRGRVRVSTLLEILDEISRVARELREILVSTLLEILGLAYLVLVGF